MDDFEPDQISWGFRKMEELWDWLAVMSRPCHHQLLSGYLTLQLALLYNIAKATLKEISSASASYHHPKHVIISQKYMVCHVLLLKYRPEKLLYVTV